MITAPKWNDLAQLLQSAQAVAVVGASNDATKYGYTVYKRFHDLQYQVYPVNPNQKNIQGAPSYPTLRDLPQKPTVVSVITPPKVSRQILNTAESLSIPTIWFQPGAYDQELLKEAASMKITVIAGPCILVSLTVLKGLGRIHR